MNERQRISKDFLKRAKQETDTTVTATQTTPPATKSQPLAKSERKNIEAVIRSITPRDRYMSVRKEKENTLKTFLMSFDSYEQLPSRIEDVIIGALSQLWKDNYHRKFSIYYEILTRLAQAQ